MNDHNKLNTPSWVQSQNAPEQGADNSSFHGGADQSREFPHQNAQQIQHHAENYDQNGYEQPSAGDGWQEGGHLVDDWGVSDHEVNSPAKTGFLGRLKQRILGVGSSFYHFISMIGHCALVGTDFCVGRIFGRSCKEPGSLEDVALHEHSGASSHPRRHMGIAAKVGLAFLVMLVGGVSVFYYMMGSRSMPLNFLKADLEQSLSKSFGGAVVRIDEALLQRDTDKGGLFVRLTNMELRGVNGEMIASTPETGIGLKFLPMFIGRFEPDSVDIIAPEIHLIRNDQGDWTLRSGGKRSAGGKVINDAGLTGIDELIEKSIAAENKEAVKNEGSMPEHLARLGDIVQQGLNKAHNQLQQSINLSYIGVRKARLVLHQSSDGAGDEWLIPSFTLQYDSAENNKLIGSGVIKHANDPGAGVWVSISHHQGQRFVDVDTKLENVVPSELSSLVPVLASLRPVKVGVSGEMQARLHLSEGLESGHLKVSLSDGYIGLLGDDGPSFAISRGAFEFDMEAGAKHIVMQRGDLFYPNGRISLKGDVWRENARSELPDWRFQLYSTDGDVFSNDPEVNGTKIEEFIFSGRLFGERAPVSIDEFRAKIGSGRIIMAHDGSQGYPAILRGQVSDVQVNLVKALWPEGFKPESRDWVFKNVRQGKIRQGVIALQAPGSGERIVLKGEKVHNTELPSMKIEVSNLIFKIFDDPLPIKTKSATVEIRGKSMLASMKQGVSSLKGNKILISDGNLVIPDYEPKGPDGVIDFKFDTNAAFMDSLFRRKPFEHRSALQEKLQGLSGDVSGSLKVMAPLADDVKPEDVEVDGTVQLKNASADVGSFKLKNGLIDFVLGKNFVEAKGNLLINGVSAQIAGNRKLQDDSGAMPALVISGTYDEADRNQLGFSVNEFVRGAVPVEVTFKDVKGEFNTHVYADLSGVELNAKSLGWKKEKEIPATLNLDVVTDDKDRVSLENFNIEGPDVTARGRMELDDEGEVKSFEFPDVSYKVVSNINLKGTIDRNKIWQISAGGKTFDGRGLLKTMLRTGEVGAGGKGAISKGSKGINLKAKFDNVMGWQQSKVNRFSINMQRQGEVLKQFVMGGTLQNGGSLTANLVSEKNADPIIRVRTSDAGEAMRFVGFYPNMLGGNGQLIVRYNVKTRQLASQTGELIINNFSIASDPVVKEVLANVSKGKKSTVGGQDYVPFNRLVAPFSIGQGQFILHDSYVKGDLLGATMRGRIDFEREEVRLSGTYVPLYGLNAAVGAVPVLGDILVGRRGEGMLGITFGIYGNIRKPEVLVNPMSLVAPGVFRQIFEFDQGSQKIKARPNQPKGQGTKLDSSASEAVRRSESANDNRSPETSASSVVRRGAAN